MLEDKTTIAQESGSHIHIVSCGARVITDSNNTFPEDDDWTYSVMFNEELNIWIVGEHRFHDYEVDYDEECDYLCDKRGFWSIGT